MKQSGTGVLVRGWAIDPDTHSPIHVIVHLDASTPRLVADISRPDIALAYPAFGPLHGYSVRLPAAAGTRTACATAINVGAGQNVSLGCRTITVNYSPFGEITTLTQIPGGFTVTGWAIDHDQPRPALAVQLTVDASTTPATANLPRPDVAARYPTAGAAHGFSITGHANEGVRRICIRATNIGLGANATLACRTVTLNSSPVGAITSLTQIPGGFRVKGWAVDPGVSAPVTVTVLADATPRGSTVARLASSTHTGHGFDASYLLGAAAIPPGTHTICVSGANVDAYGHNRQMACRAIMLNYNPIAAVTRIRQRSPGYQVTGWATDPDRSAAIHVIVTTDGRNTANVVANTGGGLHAGHNFVLNVPTVNGRHTVCIAGVNVSYGTGNSAAACATVTLNFNPVGRLERLSRIVGSTNIGVTGWAIDPDTTNPTPVRVSIDGQVVGTRMAGVLRPDLATTYPGYGPAHGLAVRFPVTPAEHRVCASAVNVLGGTGDTAIGCRIINAVHPVVPTVPRSVVAVAGYGSARVTWAAPASDGGAPWTSFTVSATGGRSITVGATARAATITGLASNVAYGFYVVATNVAGHSVAGRSPFIRTPASPPPQTTAAPISTSRYTRNISGSSSTDLSKMRAEGAADALANPSGHSYLILLDIGGQDQADQGVVLSATTRFVSYADLVRDLEAYVDGYASRHRPSAPVTIAIGTNNDMDVSSTSGAAWARAVVNPVRAHAALYAGVGVAGANDIEPGFRATYTQSKAWLAGYRSATSAWFVFNGSADGCAWTVTGRACNNGWTMAGLYSLSAGSRIVSLPQIYNNTMAAQWKYISLTGIAAGGPRVTFGGALTEFTACAQAGGCGSLTGTAAWIQMWQQLQSSPALKVASLPYSTDLRIDR